MERNETHNRISAAADMEPGQHFQISRCFIFSTGKSISMGQEDKLSKLEPAREFSTATVTGVLYQIYTMGDVQ